MKRYSRIFFISFMVLLIVLSIMFFSLTDNNAEVNTDRTGESVTDGKGEEADSTQDEPDLESLIEARDRVNVLCFGIDGGRADTIMLVSYDYENKLVDVVSIPRDTYHYIEGYESGGQKKINAVYGMRDIGGGEGLKDQVADLLNIPIDYYVEIDYNGFENIIDAMGGVEYEIPFPMHYDDPYASPPLHIHFDKGLQTLNGEEAVEFLRWRKNNGQAGQGDLPRIERQLDFLMTAAKQTIGPKLPGIVSIGFDNVHTDMTFTKASYYAAKSIGMDFNDIRTYTLPGEAEYIGGVSYYIHDSEATEQLFMEIYTRPELYVPKEASVMKADGTTGAAIGMTMENMTGAAVGM